MDLKEKYTQQLIALENTLSDFRKALGADMGKYDDLEQNWIKNAQVQKFEFYIELFWKTAKSYFEIEGETLLTPKQNIKALFLHKLVGEGQYLELMNCMETFMIVSILNKEQPQKDRILCANIQTMKVRRKGLWADLRARPATKNNSDLICCKYLEFKCLT
jgi:hypothetical protein